MAQLYYNQNAANEINGLRSIASSKEIPGALGKQAKIPMKKAVKVETAKELRKKLKEAEKRERNLRKAEKRMAAENKAADKRRQVALDALEQVARGGGINAVSAARTLLELG